ncbi:hypothetical protein HII31_04138 [Pseudocercospora fuligena]|uniref:Uncharacterized protein n=1 Tax=Pseudocercospora fuligena TaxID=685502 RepID=A0A8H6RPV3_9PEZI|nr:hypothetical protein HII31_04138 [Pseudocercospora fuligena]
MTDILVESPVMEKTGFDHKIASTMGSTEPALTNGHAYDTGVAQSNGLHHSNGHVHTNGHAREDAVEHLTPRSRTPQPKAMNRTDSMLVELEYYNDDCHDAYEWVRLPKQRNWDVLAVKRDASSERNTANTPLTATRHDGKTVIMWAKMDTGADANTINESTLSALLGPLVEDLRQPLNEEEIGKFNLIGDNDFKPTHFVELSFHAGKSNKSFHDIRFVVVPDDAAKASQDGVPNLILGLPTLRKYSMVMMDLDYHMEPEAGLEVIAGKAEEEHAGFQTIGPIIMRPPRPGVKRPGPR